MLKRINGKNLIIFLLFLVSIIFAIVCLTKNEIEDRFNEIEIGMRKKSVEKILGYSYNGIYQIENNDIILKYDKDSTLIAKTITIKNRLGKSILVGPLALVTSNKFGGGVTFMSGVMLNGFKLQFNKKTKYKTVKGAKNFELLNGKYYEAFGNTVENDFYVDEIAEFHSSFNKTIAN